MIEFIKGKFSDSVINENGFVEKYTTPHNEYSSLKYGVGVRLTPRRSVIKLTGNDVIDFLHRVSTNSISNLSENEHTNTLFLTEKGRVIDRTTFVRLKDYCYLIGTYEVKDKLLRWLDKYIIMEEIEVTDLSDEMFISELYGKEVDAYLTLLCGKNADELNDANVLNIETDGYVFKVLKYYTVADCYCYVILNEADDEKLFTEYLIENKSVFNFHLAGRIAYDEYRIEKGIPQAPYELNDNFNAHEVGLIHEVDFKKGCYIGQEVIARLDTYDKVQRNLKGVKLSNDANLQLPAPLLDENGKEVGMLTSLSKKHDKDYSVGLALVRNAYSDTGTELTAKSGDTGYTVTIKKLPL